MDKKKKKNQGNTREKVVIDDEKGISISYSTKDVKKKFPHLFDELKKSNQKIEITGIKHPTKVIEKSDELYNPTAEDFLRRCNTQEEAFEILEFLLKRKKISKEKYTHLMNRLKNEGVECFGERKAWGYYERKYRPSK